MSRQATIQIPDKSVASSSSLIRSGVLQRKCACGGNPGPTGECAECKRKSLLQPKLTINEPGDKYEQEADRIAKQVMWMPASSAASDSPRHIQRVQSRASSGVGFGGVEVPTVVHDVINSPGRSLDAATRGFMEPRFGHDFSRVRVHADAQAAASARAAHSRAYTVGRDVVFGASEFAPSSEAGRALLAHELTHVIQQGAASMLDDSRPGSTFGASHLPDGKQFLRVQSPSGIVSAVQRSPLNVGEIATDITDGMNAPPQLSSWLHVMGERSGEIAHAAATPTGSAPNPPPDPIPVPIDRTLPVEAHFFPSYQRHTDRRALIIGGFHGDERPGYEMTAALVAELQQQGGHNYVLAFHTLIIPRLNIGAITDDLTGSPGYDTRCNRQLVDLNRNLPAVGASHSSPRCRNTATAPVQPETQGVMNVLRDFRPHRIISTHAIRNPRSAGIFADPNTHPSATALACSLAGRVVDPTDRPANRLTSTSCNAIYPGDRAGALPSGGTLGRYAWRLNPQSQEVTPVITLEAPSYGPLSTGTGARSIGAFLRPLRAFISNATPQLNSEDAAILNGIRGFSLASRRLFLTGRLSTAHRIYRRIRRRITAQVVALNALSPRPPTQVRVVSQQRAFADRLPGATSQAQIVLEKFTLIGARANGWDSLPDRYFNGGNRSRGVNRSAWLSESSATRLAIILRFSAIPGASRHHWGTEVDFNSTTSSHWSVTTGPRGGPGRLFRLGQWLQANASRVGFVQTYTPGRSGGHEEEPWHYSYAPVAGPLRTLFNQEVRLDQDIVDHIMTDWATRASAAGVTLPSDLRRALRGLNLSKFVNTIGPGL